MSFPVNLLVIAVAAMLGGNSVAAPAVGSEELQLLGVIEKATQQTRQREPSQFLMVFGLLGGLASAGIAGSQVQTNAYEVLNANGELVSVMTDDVFAVGACVTIVPIGISPGNSYPYGTVSLRLSEKCAENGLAIAK